MSPRLQPDGWDTDCTTGQLIPGTAPWPPFDLGAESSEDGAVSMPPATGTDRGQTVAVTVQGVSGHAGHELAGVLYEGRLTDVGREAIGGFWAGITSDDFTLNEVVRIPRDDGEGRFPSVLDEALMVEPGTHTLVLWVDVGLGAVTRWVPLNSDGQGLFGCQLVFEVAADAQTQVTVSPALQPDGWNADCQTP